MPESKLNRERVEGRGVADRFGELADVSEM